MGAFVPRSLEKMTESIPNVPVKARRNHSCSFRDTLTISSFRADSA
jgi:hypothetical protein